MATCTQGSFQAQILAIVPSRILIEGRAGSGKTIVAARLAGLLRERGVDVRGFFTRELREHRRRVGFTVETLDGRDATLAHVDRKGPPRVGKYGVDLAAFERVALPALDDLAHDAVVLVDELGKMELASERFRELVLSLFETSAHIVATIHIVRHPVTDSLKRRADVELVRVTQANRDTLPAAIADRVA